ncbi:MAG: phage baseplate assembly protein V [Terriglobia bacterium]
MAAKYLTININGESITEAVVNHISVTQQLNHHGYCQAECRHTEDQRTSHFLSTAIDQASGSQSIVRVEDWLGKKLQVVSHDPDGDYVVFHGFVLEVELVYELTGGYTALIQGVTDSYKMDLTPRHAYYQEKTLADVANQLASNAGLKATVQCQDRRPLNYVQWGESDFEFLRRLADDHGCWLRPAWDATGEGGDSADIEIHDSFQAKTTVAWRADTGDDKLTSFSVKGALSPASFNGAHYDFHQMKSQTYTKVTDDPQFFDSLSDLVKAVKDGSKDVLPPGYLNQRTRVVTLDDYEKALKKESVRSIGSSVSGSGSSHNQKLLPGNQIEIKGVPDAEGDYGITHVAHSWDPSAGYENQFTCTPWKNYTDPQPPEFKPWCGVVPARVVEHDDPKKMGRIKVQYFWQEDAPAYWARMITPHAGAGRGFMFMPEKGDEVAVGFEDGDPERPIIFGCVWNGVDQAPRGAFRADDIAPNDVKRIVTKSGNRLQMVDTPGKESMVLSTPNSLKVSMIEAGGSPTGRETLILQSDTGDIILNAPKGRIHFHCKHFSREVG